MRRDGLWASFLAIAVLFAFAMALVFSYRDQVVHLKDDIYRQCVSRLDYDQSSQHVRAVSRGYWQTYIATEAHNQFIDAKLRAQRIAAAQTMVDALTDTLGKSVRGGCNQYR